MPKCKNAQAFRPGAPWLSKENQKVSDQAKAHPLRFLAVDAAVKVTATKYPCVSLQLQAFLWPQEASFLNQRIAIPQMLVEPRRRLSSEPHNDTEHFDGQLAEAVVDADNWQLPTQRQRTIQTDSLPLIEPCPPWH